MNTKDTMILIKGEIKTSEVASCTFQADTQKWDVTFANGKTYSYGSASVERLDDPERFDPELYQIRRNGRRLFDITGIYVFSGKQESFWHVCFQDGRERDYRQGELTVVKSCLSQKKSADVFAYLKEIAKLSEIKDEETGEALLSKRFETITYVGEDTALARYLDPASRPGGKTGWGKRLGSAGESSSENSSESSRDGLSEGAGERSGSETEYAPIFPFGCNNSQYTAVKNAMEHQISVIQGPPGTGKTQTILNIIANILMQGKTVQIVSNNNSATENVYEKLSSPRYGLGFIAVTLGSQKNKQAFVEQQDGRYPEVSSWRLEGDLELLREQIAGKSAQLKTVFDQKERLARLKQEYAQLITEQGYFAQLAEDLKVDTERISGKERVSSRDWMQLMQACQRLSEENRTIGIWFKIQAWIRYGLTDWSFYRQDLAAVITAFQARYYQARQAELTREIEETERYLDSVDQDLLEDLCRGSMALLKDKLAQICEGKDSRPVFTEEELWRRPDQVLREYPVILSTTFSSRNSLNPDVVYDYLIMDEASQVDIATGALALSCARNVVIVGDTKQLPNVVTREVKEKADAVFARFQIQEGYQFTRSFLQSILDVMPGVTQTLLREHYRCHPKIIDFCNQKFYRGELIIMTEDYGETDVLAAVKTAVGNHARNHYSQRQIDVIQKEIIPRFVSDPEETGIIAPYKNQVEALEREICGIDAATVHKFQGKEKDTIIISTVDDEISDFADDPYLINVAVSRAKKRLILVMTGNQQEKERNIIDLMEYIQYHNFEVTDSKVYSIFDYLYKQYEEVRRAYLQKHKRISEYDSENLMHALIEDILTDDRFASLDVVCHFPLYRLLRDLGSLDEEERRYVRNPASHLDFLIYNRISKKPVLGIEVDGYDYHGEGTEQAVRDQKKDHILEQYGIPLLRFKTNGSGEKEAILEALERAAG